MTAGEHLNPGVTSRNLAESLGKVILSRRFLALLLLTGFLLRAANLLWGIPISPYSTFYHADEPKAWGSTAEFPEGYISNESYLYGTSLQYAIGTMLLPIKAYMVWNKGAPHHYVLVVIIFSRFIHVLMGTASIALIYLLGIRLCNPACGMIAASLVCVAPSLALTSCYTTLDVPMGFLVLCGFLAGLNATESGRIRDFILWGGICGTLLGTKITGGLFLIVSIGWCLFLLRIKIGSRVLGLPSRVSQPSRGVRLSSIVFLLVSAAGVFAVTCPQIVLDIPEYLAFMQRQKTDWYDKAPRNPMMIVQNWWTATSLALGPIVTVLATIGLLPWRRSQSTLSWVMVSLIGLNYFFWQGYLLPRLIAPVGPLVCLFAGLVLSKGIGSTKTWLRLLSLLILCVSLGRSLHDVGRGVWQRWHDPRTEASKYIAQHIPPQATIGIAVDHDDRWQHHQSRYPQIDFDRLNEIYFLMKPEWIVVTSLECDTMRAALKSEFLGPGYQWDQNERGRWYLSKPPSSDVFHFFEDLLADKTYRLEATFEAYNQSQTEVSVPSIYVYRRRDAAGP